MHVPEDIAPIVEAVLGLDNRPQASPHFRRPRTAGSRRTPRAGRVASPPSSSPSCTTSRPVPRARARPSPSSSSAAATSAADLEDVFHGARRAAAAEGDGGRRSTAARNRPARPDGADGEVMLDIEVAGAVAPGRADRRLLRAEHRPRLPRRDHDARCTTPSRKPSVISISWGGAGGRAGPAQAHARLRPAFQDAAALGVTVCAAAGDNGSTDGVERRQGARRLPGLEPARRSPAAARGSRRRAARSRSEVVWNEGRQDGATGGGVSERLRRCPRSRSGAKVPDERQRRQAGPGRARRRRRRRPADRLPGPRRRPRRRDRRHERGGAALGGAGRAASTQKLGKPRRLPQPGPLRPAGRRFRDIDAGRQRRLAPGQAYKAGPGWDACTGLGSPNGAALLEALQAGTPSV